MGGIETAVTRVDLAPDLWLELKQPPLVGEVPGVRFPDRHPLITVLFRSIRVLQVDAQHCMQQTDMQGGVLLSSKCQARAPGSFVLLAGV